MMPFPQRVRSYLPVRGLRFRQPLVLFQSDDWGLCGIRDHARFAELCAAGMDLGKNPYDYHSLETAEDLAALYTLLARHHDHTGRSPAFVFNFIMTNVDCARALAHGLTAASLVPLDKGFPNSWDRPGLLDAYRRGLAQGFLYPALHGVTHFCQSVAARILKADDARGSRLRAMYAAQTPLLYSQAPWLSFEYRDDSDAAHTAWLDANTQRDLIAQGVTHFRRIFGSAPSSACAPGYRANAATRQGYVAHHIHIAQNGDSTALAPYWDASGLLMLHRNTALEPALDAARYTVAHAIAQAQRAAAAGLPIVVSMHALNFHSTLKNFRDETLLRLDDFLTALARAFPDLRYVHDDDLWHIARQGSYSWAGQTIPIERTPFWQRSPAMAWRLEHA